MFPSCLVFGGDRQGRAVKQVLLNSGYVTTLVKSVDTGW